MYGNDDDFHNKVNYVIIAVCCISQVVYNLLGGKSDKIEEVCLERSCQRSEKL